MPIAGLRNWQDKETEMCNTTAVREWNCSLVDWGFHVLLYRAVPKVTLWILPRSALSETKAVDIGFMTRVVKS